MNKDPKSEQPPPANIKDWLKLIITSPLAAALTTALIGAFLTNYVVDVYKRKSVAAERKIQRQSDLAARQFETIQKLIEFESEFYVAAEFAFFNLIERRQDISKAVFEGIAGEYDTAAKSFIANGYKAAFAAEIYLSDESSSPPGEIDPAASSVQDGQSIQSIFKSLVGTEAQIACYVCMFDDSAADFPEVAKQQGEELREQLRSQHIQFVKYLKLIGTSIYHPATP